MASKSLLLMRIVFELYLRLAFLDLGFILIAIYKIKKPYPTDRNKITKISKTFC